MIQFRYRTSGRTVQKLALRIVGMNTEFALDRQRNFVWGFA